MIDGEIIQSTELMVVLNQLTPPFRVTYPCTGVKLFNIQVTDAGFQFNDFVQSAALDVETQDEALDREFPKYNDLVECFLHAGLIQYSNLDEFVKRVNRYRTLETHICFSPDTNLLYHGFFSNNSLVASHDIVVVSTVPDEIHGALNHKYRRNEIQRLQQHVPYHPELLAELMNRRKMRSRKAAYLAVRDYEVIQSHAQILDAPDVPFSSSSDNDLAIIRTLKTFDQNHQSIPFLLTADDAMTDQCKMENIKYFLFHYPQNFLISKCTAAQLLELLLNLCGVLGSLQINSTILMGEYKGKRNASDIKVHFLNKELQLKVKKHLDLCRNLEQLSITH